MEKAKILTTLKNTHTFSKYYVLMHVIAMAVILHRDTEQFGNGTGGGLLS